jgi:hypothetical protein
LRLVEHRDETVVDCATILADVRDPGLAAMSPPARELVHRDHYFDAV